MRSSAGSAASSRSPSKGLSRFKAAAGKVNQMSSGVAGFKQSSRNRAKQASNEKAAAGQPKTNKKALSAFEEKQLEKKR